MLLEFALVGVWSGGGESNSRISLGSHQADHPHPPLTSVFAGRERFGGLAGRAGGPCWYPVGSVALGTL